MNRRLLHLVVSKSLGCLLLAAAGLKIYGFGMTPVGAIGIFSSPSFQVGLIEFEILLGLWLLSGKSPIGSWLVAIAGFASFGAVSFYLGWIGQASCGCFGQLSVSPWYAFGIDLVAILALLVGQPDLKQLRREPPSILLTKVRRLFAGLTGVSLLVALFAGSAIYWFDSPEAALAYFRGERLSVRPALVDVGEGAPGETRVSAVELVNRTDHEIRIVGGTFDCSCAVTDDLPVTIPPGQSRSVTIRVHLPRTPGILTRRAALVTDDEGFRMLGFRLTGRITNPSPEPEALRVGRMGLVLRNPNFPETQSVGSHAFGVQGLP